MEVRSAAECNVGNASAWSIPKEGIWCLLYYVFIHSITTYFLMVELAGARNR